MDKRRLTGLIAAGLALILLLLAAFSNSWIIGENYDIKSKVGLRSVSICADDSSCESVTLPAKAPTVRRYEERSGAKSG